jgi:hypothetical protein
MFKEGRGIENGRWISMINNLGTDTFYGITQGKNDEASLLAVKTESIMLLLSRFTIRRN